MSASSSPLDKFAAIVLNSDPRQAKLQTKSSSSASSTIAESIDSFTVYEEAVQTPAIECTNLESLYYNAQEIGSPRPNARILREDFSSTSAVAVHWLTMNHEHRSQAVDIDLDALKIARRRLLKQRHPLGDQWTCKLLQHAEYNSTGKGSRWLDDGGDGESSRMAQEGSTNADSDCDDVKSTWSKGATTDRFERKFQAKQAKLRQKHQQERAKDKAKAAKKFGRSLNNLDQDGGGGDDEEEDSCPHLMLLHSSVLSLPVPAPPKASRHAKAPAPDIVASLNYALSYFHKRKDLVNYLSSVQRSLRRNTGVLISDQFAGPMGEAARKDYGEGRELTADEEVAEQEELWGKFVHEPGFLRRGETVNNLPSTLENRAGVQCWRPEGDDGVDYEQVHSQDGANSAIWPRGRLSLVRKGEVPLKQEGQGTRMVEFEYWREDTPVDLRTNTFRMSLSFRFTEDGSWVRDYFSYNFRYWTMAEVVEAMEEAGFADINVQVIDRGAADEKVSGVDGDGNGDVDGNGKDSDSDATDSDLGGDDDGDDDAYAGMSFFTASLKQASKPAAAGYRRIEDDEKVFARRSFGSECGQGMRRRIYVS